MTLAAPHSILLGMEGTQAESSRIRLLHETRIGKTIPDTALVEVLSGGKLGLPLGGPITIGELRQIIGQERARGTSVFCYAKWVLSTAMDTLSTERLTFIVQLPRGRVDCAKLFENYLVSLDYRPLEPHHHNEPYLRVSTELSNPVLTLSTQYGDVGIVIDAPHIVPNIVETRMSLYEMLSVFQALILQRPQRVVYKEHVVASREFLCWLWNGIRTMRPDAAYAYVAGICLSCSYPDPGTSLILLQMLCAALTLQAGRISTHTDTALVMQALFLCMEDMFMCDIEKETAVKPRFVPLLATVAIETIVTKKYDAFNMFNLARIRALAIGGRAIRKPMADTLYVHDYISAGPVRALAANFPSLIYVDSELAMRYREQRHESVFELSTDCANIVVGKVHPVKQKDDMLISMSRLGATPTILRLVDKDLVVDAEGSAFNTQFLSTDFEEISIRCSLCGIARTQIDTVTENPLFWMSEAMKTQLHAVHIDAVAAMKVRVDDFPDTAVELSSLIFTNLYEIDLTYLPISTETFSTLLLAAFLVPGALVYTGRCKFNVVDQTALYWLFSFLVEYRPNLSNLAGAYGPLVETVWFPSPGAVRVAMDWAIQHDAVVLCPTEAFEVFSGTVPTIRHDSIDGAAHEIIEYGTIVLYEPSRLGPVARTRLLKDCRFCYMLVIGEFVSDIETWEPWLSRTFPPMLSLEERLFRSLRGTPLKYTFLELRANPNETPINAIANFARSTHVPLVIVLKRREEYIKILELLIDLNPQTWDHKFIGNLERILFVRAHLFSGYEIPDVVCVLATDLDSGYRMVHRCTVESHSVPTLYLARAPH